MGPVREQETSPRFRAGHALQFLFVKGSRERVPRAVGPSFSAASLRRTAGRSSG